MLVPITSIFQHDARCYEECNRGRPSPRAASKLDHHVNRDAARMAQPTRAVLSRMSATTLKGLLAPLTTLLANGVWTNTQMLHNQNSATPQKPLLLFFSNQYHY